MNAASTTRSSMPFPHANLRILLLSFLVAVVASVSGPMARAQAKPAAGTISVPNVHLISAMGAKCLGVSGGNHTPGTATILWDCGTQQDQLFVFTKTGEIRAFGGQYFSNTFNGHPIGYLCLDITGGLIKAGQPVMIWSCNGQPNQRWSLRQGQMNTATNYQLCLDIEGGWFGLQNTQLKQCTQQPNQRFRYGIAAAPGRSTSTIASGTQTNIGMTINSAAVVSNDGGSIVAQGGGNIVAQGGGNIVAQGGGNIDAQGGGNVIVPGGDTINTGN
jgi:hypothetical protein